jgi:hypothetical protein
MSAVNAKPTFNGSLRGFHELWIAETRRFIEPAMVPGADFWTRWAAVRYLADDFRERYWIERRLVDRLELSLPTSVAAGLAAEGEQVYGLRLELDRVGRRRGTAEAFAAAAGALLERLGLWLAEIERVALLR